VPLAKAQSFRWEQGPVSRWLGLATVHVDTAGRHFSGAALLRPAGQGADWIAQLPLLARAARGDQARGRRAIGRLSGLEGPPGGAGLGDCSEL
jgi:hypothetical protein